MYFKFRFTRRFDRTQSGMQAILNIVTHMWRPNFEVAHKSSKHRKHCQTGIHFSSIIFTPNDLECHAIYRCDTSPHHDFDKETTPFQAMFNAE